MRLAPQMAPQTTRQTARRTVRRTARLLRPSAMRSAALAALLLPLLQSAQAINYTWVGNNLLAPTSWANPLNWAGSLVPQQGDDTGLLFPNSFVLASNDLAAGFRLNRIRAFDNGGQGGVGNIGGQLITLSGANAELFVGAGGTLAVNAPLSGSVAFSKTGAGDLSLAGNNLALTGDFTIAQGRVNALAAGNLGSGAITVATGAALRSGGSQFIGGISGGGSWQADGFTSLAVASGERSFSGAITGSSAFSKSGAGRQVFAGSVTSGGPVTVGGGELALAGAAARWNGATSLAVANAATARVSGGAQWVVNGGVTLGGGSALVSTGALAVDAGSRFTSAGATMGETAADRGSASVQAGGRWTNGAALVMGQGGSGRLDVAGVGASATALAATLGVLPGSTGTLALDQGGSFAAGLTLTVGSAGQGTVNVNGGGLLSSATGIIGQSVGGNGVVALSGAGSTWSNTGAITVGQQGQGRLSLNNAQGSVAGNMVLGLDALGQGTLQLDNSATWGVGGSFVVGQRGTGAAVVNGGAVLTTQGAVVGLQGGAGEVNLSTAGRWQNNGTLVIGSASQGWLFLASGATVNTGNTTVGLAPLPGNAQFTGNVLADAATLNVNGELRLADAGSARMDLTGGTQLQSTTAVLAERAGSSARVLVAGTSPAPTRWTNTQGFVVGKAGTAELTLSGAAQLSTGAASIGLPGGSGRVVMDNSGPDLPSWLVNGTLDIGAGGSGSIEVRDGTLRSGSATIGSLPVGSSSTSGSVTVNSPQAAWFIDGNLGIGGSDPGRIGGLLIVNNGGLVRSTGTATLQANSVVNLGSGGTWSAGALAFAEGSRLNWTGGTLEITGPQGVTLGSTPFFGRVFSLSGDQTLAVARTLRVGTGTLVLNDSATVRASVLTLDGGQVVGNSIYEPSGNSEVRGRGLLGVATLRGGFDSRIVAEGGTLSVGNPNLADGFSTEGIISVGADARLVLMSAATVTLGRSSTLDTRGTLQTYQGARLQPGHVLQAPTGGTVLGRFTNNGIVGGGAGPGQALVFNDDVDGSGRYVNQVLFRQTFAPGAGTLMHRLDFTETGRLLLTGLGTASLTAAPVRVTEAALLGGTLSLHLDGSFMVPEQGATLRLIDWASFSGSFASFTVGGLDPSWVAQLDYGSDALRLNISAVPEPATWMAMLMGVAMLLARRRLGAGRPA